ncbi:spondin domain-containing protein [Winogradskyella sp. PE311]|uniref:T9SS type A sorting domain-containing protein n=1 Tax=Winogradskyella sp. PE311 TaxID=3366943 RepID=UPI00398101B1
MKKTTLSLLVLFVFLASKGIIAQSTAAYDISFTSTWNSSDHGTLPGSAHWSNLVGVNHNNNVTFLELGGTATQGIENVAEAGSNSVFNSEVQTAINAGNAEQWLSKSFSPFAAISTATLSDISISEEYPLLTLVSMIAPSPDWIIAVNGLNLWDTNTSYWKEIITVDLFPYDAGTEDGFGYSGNNSATNPRGVISNISGASGYPFNTEKIGTLTITLKNTTLSTATSRFENKIKMFPNPNNSDSVTIFNSNVLNEIAVYDVLGKRVKLTKTSTNSENKQILNIKDLNQGIYIVRLTNKNGTIGSKKLIVN